MDQDKNNVDRYNDAVGGLSLLAAHIVGIMGLPLILGIAALLIAAIVYAFGCVFLGFGMVFKWNVSDGLTLVVSGIAVLAGLAVLVVGMFFNESIENWRARRRLEKEAGQTPKPAGKIDPLDDFGKI